jgi:hypothetical protein
MIFHAEFSPDGLHILTASLDQRAGDMAVLALDDIERILVQVMLQALPPPRARGTPAKRLTSKFPNQI